VDFGELSRSFNHIWKKTSAAGRCQEITVWKVSSSSLGRSQVAAPLRSADTPWSTLGGDTRSFAKVLRSNPITQSGTKAWRVVMHMGHRGTQEGVDLGEDEEDSGEMMSSNRSPSFRGEGEIEEIAFMLGEIQIHSGGKGTIAVR
jgi:hypothetical protein